MLGFPPQRRLFGDQPSDDQLSARHEHLSRLGPPPTALRFLLIDLVCLSCVENVPKTRSLIKIILYWPGTRSDFYIETVFFTLKCENFW